ncbi:Gfo/Idh/MocA family oxidoreductase [Nocardiopsis dassonvillei]|uniref:Gfo/Idh/MocA family protein n=1 Tax=Nocardiopsis dassonvillei TaxID=2014 RepID=UPI0020A2797E|nr:Gfo/Idh/MocA family oxidoreductase [Nocardiopsis dassonvillei]MCP3016910.1 Gfo/Idh/MocA family oxidoreductase [Nocardiopsis dassonvillei]
MPSPRPPIRVAVVGSGGITRGRHLPALAALGDRVEVVALADLDASRVAATADEWGVPGRYTGLDALLRAESPDLVIVCTPPVAHKDAVIASLDAGCWVWCEKPPALSLAEYDEACAHEGSGSGPGGGGGPFVSYVFQHRFGSGAERLRRHLAEGTLGRPLVGVCNTLWFRAPDYFEVPWRGRWATEGGGPSMGHGIHQMDLMLSLLGDWSEVTAVMSTTARTTETEDVSMAIVRLESGATVSVANSLLSPRETSYLRFDFEHATVELEHLYGYDNAHWRWTPAPHVRDTDAVASWPPVEDEPSSHRAQLAALLDAMERGERPRASGPDGRRALELVTGMYRSALTGTTARRRDLTPDDGFYHAMHGGDADTAAAVLTRTEETTGV